MKIAVVGATGLVGTKMLEILAERKFPVSELIPVASEKSLGSSVNYLGKPYKVVLPADAIAQIPQLVLFSAGGSTSLEWAPQFAKVGSKVIDNSSAWRMDPSKKLIVPEINAESLTADDFIIANPNCSTIQMVVALNPLHLRYRIRRIIVSTYQSVTGTGKKAVDQLYHERRLWQNGTNEQSSDYPKAYKYPIDLNLIPQVDVFTDNGYTKEELKMVNETRKILGDDSIAISATTVRVPVIGGHSESINVEFENEFVLEDVFKILSQSPGVVVSDNINEAIYPMPISAHNRDEVFVGRIRRDFSQPKTLNLWCVSDNLRKGAATNAIQIAEVMIDKGLV